MESLYQRNDKVIGVINMFLNIIFFTDLAVSRNPSLYFQRFITGS